MQPARVQCLILACGNTLRSDDGLGPWLADWAEARFHTQPGIRVLTRQQWTPELSAEIAAADAVLFLDCSIDSEVGLVQLVPAEAVEAADGLATHHMGASELLHLARALYQSTPDQALLLTVGAGSTEFGEQFSAAVTEALPQACERIEAVVEAILAASREST
jgi:hydrogenase maturation protease